MRWKLFWRPLVERIPTARMLQPLCNPQMGWREIQHSGGTCFGPVGIILLHALRRMPRACSAWIHRGKRQQQQQHSWYDDRSAQNINCAVALIMEIVA